MLRSLNLLQKPYLGSHIYSKRSKSLTIETLNSNIKRMFLMDENDKVYLRYLRLKKELEEHPASVPFKEFLEAGVGDLQASCYPYITFLRQMAAAAIYPSLINDSNFPEDVKSKAKMILQNLKSVGTYTASPGHDFFRTQLAKYISERDDVPCDFNNVIINGGITEGIRNILRMVCNCKSKKPQGVLIPLPSYPYGLVEEYGFVPILYKLEEELNWFPSMTKLEDKVESARKECDPRIMIVINPGNPTGAVWKREQIEEIIQFACYKRLIIVADEAYQDNVYTGSDFLSFKKVMFGMGKPYSEHELVSCSGISKGFCGEPGLRAGFAEIVNFDKNVMVQFYKSISVNLCSPTVGQVVLYALVNRPVKGEPSYELWKKETETTKMKLESQSKMMVPLLNKIKGFSCKPIEGAYAAYPKITVPEKAAIEGKQRGYGPSTYYGVKLLEQTGVLVTPGDIFGEQEASQ